ncbi:MAG: hypothetical protein M1830_007923 [Pleopsidium flavum]|nr:MAG: hypothetical protein M1830_007923 [Pleopsidium flavum]
MQGSRASSQGEALPHRRRELSVAPNPRFQAGSPILQRLPAEIRSKIYYEVFGGEILHLVQLPKRLGHVRCRAPSSTDPLRTCMPDTRGPASAREIKTSSLDLPLLQSCRQVYVEAISILYACNVLDLDDASSLLYLSQTIRPQRLAAVKRLQLKWDFLIPPLVIPETKDPEWFPRDDQTWESFWRVIATQMPGLVQLTLVIYTEHRKLAWNLDEGWVRPLLQVRGLKNFRLEQLFKFDSALYPSTEFDSFHQQLHDIMCATV